MQGKIMEIKLLRQQGKPMQSKFFTQTEDKIAKRVKS
jgi:hypothetical protein